LGPQACHDSDVKKARKLTESEALCQEFWIHIDERALSLDKRLFASLLIHEAVHARQWDIRTEPTERQAYQIQSNALCAWNLRASSFGAAREMFPGDADNDYLDDMISSFDEYRIRDQAWQR